MGRGELFGTPLAGGEASALRAWCQWVEAHLKHPHISLHFDGVRISASAVQQLKSNHDPTGEQQLCTRTEVIIKQATEYNLKVVVKRHPRLSSVTDSICAAPQAKGTFSGEVFVKWGAGAANYREDSVLSLLADGN